MLSSPRPDDPQPPSPTPPSQVTDSMLEQYSEKRDFARTPEPPPLQPEAGEGPPIFVVQKHAARQLHYDFRLELGGVLKSWAIPKGPSLDPGEKRLAVMVEDHPLEYGSFEGVIPKGEYGAGQVIVWDCGTYFPDEGGRASFQDRGEAEERMRRGLNEGKLSIFLLGHKLKGSWTLVKMQRGHNNWLLIKHTDRFVSPDRDLLREDRSVRSGLSIQDLAAGIRPEAHAGNEAIRARDLPGARGAPLPSSLSPMLASLVDAPFSHLDWLFEPKLDGVRAIALIDGGRVRLLSRRNLDITDRYPLLAEDLARQAAGAMALDGEIVALDPEGRPSFQLLQQRLNLTRVADIHRAEGQVPVTYYVFDLVYLDGYDLRAVALSRRKALLDRVLLPSDGVRLVEYFQGDGKAAYEAAVGQGLEGVIAKRRDSLYESGGRSSHWLKMKATLSQEFIIGGYSQGLGGRADSLGALLLGRHDDQGRLVYVSHVGTGFDDRSLAYLRQLLDPITVSQCPFAGRPPLKGLAIWVRPELVAEVKFASWTQDGHLRDPVFLHLREDKAPEEVRRSQVYLAPGWAEPAQESPSTRFGKEVEEVLRQLERSADKLMLETEGRRISLSNLDKELWPAQQGHRPLTKRDFLVYLAQIAPYLLPHLRDRPLTLSRYPDGIGGEHFYQKHWETPLPDFVETVGLFSEHGQGDQEYLLCNNLATLLWLGQVANLEFHAWFSRVSPHPDGCHLSREFAGSLEGIQGSLLNYPDFIVFDLDPYIYSGGEAKGTEPELNRKAFAATHQVALWLKEALDSLRLPSFVKTSGRTGLHIYVPILRQLDYDAVRSLTETIGRFVVQGHPSEITMEWAVEKRRGRIFLDYNQNARGKTLAAPYSPRVAAEATVSMPLRWEELGEVYPTDFTILSAPGRLARIGDLWSGIVEAKVDLGALLEKGIRGAGSVDRATGASG